MPRPFHSRSELLEARCLLAATPEVVLTTQQLEVVGTSDHDVIRIVLAGDEIRVSVNKQVTAVPAAQYSTIVVNGLDGNDVLEQRTALTTTLLGGAGDDTITGGSGIDWIFGGLGNDTLRWSPGKNYLHGGSGRDEADYSASPVGVEILGEDTGDWRPERPFAYLATILYTDRPPTELGVINYVDGATVEVFRGTPGRDSAAFFSIAETFAGFPATIYGGAGDDGFLGAGFDAIVFYGEEGNDDMSAYAAIGGRATMYGGDGDDIFAVIPWTLGDLTQIDHGPGSDWLYLPEDAGVVDVLQLDTSLPENVANVLSEPGLVPTIIGDERANIIMVGSPSRPAIAEHPVRFLGGGGDDTLLGGYGDDTLDGEAGRDLLIGRPTNPAIFPPPDEDILRGGDGSDTLHAGLGADAVLGGEGDDWLIADDDGEPDTLDGGGGFDRVLTLSPKSNDVLLNVERTLPARLSRLAVDVLLPDLSRRYRVR